MATLVKTVGIYLLVFVHAYSRDGYSAQFYLTML